MENYLFFIIIITLYQGVVSDGLTAYECGVDTTVPLLSLSLVDTTICHPSTPNITSEVTRVTIVQTKTYEEIDVFSCFWELHHIVIRCGKVIDQVFPGGVFSEQVILDRSLCEKAINGGIIADMDSQLRVKTYPASKKGSINRIDQPNVITYGNVDGDGDCTPGPSFSHGGFYFDKPIRHTSSSIRYGWSKARIDYDSDKIIFPNGQRCSFSHGECEVMDMGMVFWEKPQMSCGDHNIGSLFSGTATIIQHYEETGFERFIRVVDDGRDFQIKITEQTQIGMCNAETYRTEHPKIFVMVHGKYDFSTHIQKLPAESNSLVDFINSKFIYSIRHNTDQLKKLFTQFLHDRCETQVKIQKNMLTIASIDPIEFAFQYMGGPGYTAVKRGESIWVSKCKSVIVTPVSSNGLCYNELPVNHTGIVKYLSPRNRILSSVGTIIPCAPRIHPSFKLWNAWYTQTQHGLEKVESPTVLTIKPFEYSFERVSSIDEGGIYNRDSMEKLQSVLLNPIEVKAMTSRITTAISYTNNDLPNGASILKAIRADEFESISNKIGGFWYWFKSTLGSFGNFVSVLIGVIAIWKVFIYALNCITNFLELKAINGVIGALTYFWWDSKTHHILRKYNNNTHDNTELEEVSSTPKTTEDYKSVYPHLYPK